jgi:hypothetical protein
LAFNSNFRGFQETALMYGLKADQVFREVGDPEADVLTALILIPHFIKQGNLVKCKSEIEKITPAKFIHPDAFPWIKNYCWMQCYESLPDYDSLLHYSLLGKSVAPTRYHKAYCDAMMGFAYLQLKQYDDAINSLTFAKDENKSLGNSIEYNRYLSMIGIALTGKGDYQAAIDSLLKVKEHQDVSADVDVYASTLSTLADAYSNTGNYRKAYEYRLLLEQAMDSINSAQSRRNIADMEAKYETDQKDQEIELQKSQLRQQRLISLGAGGIALLLVLLLFFIIKSNRQRKKTNAALRLAKERAEQSEKFKQQFLANMSHEIRTPMNAILGMTNLAIESSSAERQKEYLGAIQKSSDTLLHIINDILDVSKIEAGKIEIERIDFSLREVVGQVKQILEHKAEERGIQLLTAVEENIPDVLVGDPVRLNQVLMNLCGNALKFTERGSVALRVIAGSGATKQFPKNEEMASGAKSVVAMTFMVEDTGIGIPKEKLNSIFESFTQAHSSDSRRFGGTGLGLTISKQLIELMGGALKVESEVGSGSAFSFTLELPVGSAENLSARKNSEEEIDGSILNGLKILLADDNEYNRVVATDTLKSKADVELVQVTNGREAVELLKQQDFDVVLMDVQMPEMDGFEATREIRNPESEIRNHHIPVIALTASVIRSDLDMCRAAGMDGYVPKPFKASQLIQAIANVTGKQLKTESRNPAPDSPRDTRNSKLQTSDSLDLTYLKNFCEGDEARMKKYTSMFLESIPPFKEKLEQAVAENDFEEIAKQVHAMKPKFIMMGMREAQTLAVQIESDIRESNQQHLFNPAIRRIMLICDQAEKVISESLNAP